MKIKLVWSKHSIWINIFHVYGLKFLYVYEYKRLNSYKIK